VPFDGLLEGLMLGGQFLEGLFQMVLFFCQGKGGVLPDVSLVLHDANVPRCELEDVPGVAEVLLLLLRPLLLASPLICKLVLEW